MAVEVDPDTGAADILAAVRRLAPQIIEAREETEQLRQIPPALADALAEAGLYQMYLPHSLGGPELPPLTVFEVIEETSVADGSVGWCLMNANLMALGAGWLDPEVGRRMFGECPDIRAAGSLRPQGRGWPVEGGIVSRAGGTSSVACIMPTGCSARAWS
jgi:indole-3-acetate monooxygenase